MLKNKKTLLKKERFFIGDTIVIIASSGTAYPGKTNFAFFCKRQFYSAEP